MLKLLMRLVFLFLIMFHTLISAQTIRLRGKVIDTDKKPVSNLSIRFTSFGDAVTTGSGEFIIRVPSTVRFVDVAVSENTWQLLYPVDGKVPVPADQNFITTIIVSGKNATERTGMDQSIKKYNELEDLLKEVGSTNTELQAFLERFIELESKKLEISESLFRDEFERKEKRETIFSEISRTLNEYILRTKNLKTIFEMNYEIAFVSNPTVENLNKAIGAYNPVFDSIYNNYDSWKSVISLTRDSVSANNFASSINYMIEEVHKPYIFELNKATKLINEIREDSESDDGDIKEKKKTVREKILSIMENLEVKIPILENRFKELINKLYKEP